MFNCAKVYRRLSKREDGDLRTKYEKNKTYGQKAVCVVLITR